MTVVFQEIEVTSKKGDVSFFDITSKVKEFIAANPVRTGMCLVTTSHTTCSVFYEEFTHDKDKSGTELLLRDLDDILTKLVPAHINKGSYRYPGEEHYKEVESWPNREEYLPAGDRTLLFNGDAHIKSTIIGNSVSMVIKNCQLNVGTTGYIYFVDFDQTQARSRKIQLLIVGE